MRRLTWLLLLGVMHPALAGDRAPQQASLASPPELAPCDAAVAAASCRAAATGDAPSKDSSTAAVTVAADRASGATPAAPAAEGYVPKTPYDNTPYRFDMSQQGKRMSAADFDAWMKARGLRVATGKPTAVSAPAPSASAPSSASTESVPLVSNCKAGSATTC